MLCKCKVCGATVPAYYRTQAMCDDCKWDTWIPPGYQANEAYMPDPVWDHWNATRRPALGVEFLDRSGPALSLRLPMCSFKPRGRRSA